MKCCIKIDTFYIEIHFNEQGFPCHHVSMEIFCDKILSFYVPCYEMLYFSFISHLLILSRHPTSNEILKETIQSHFSLNIYYLNY